MRKYMLLLAAAALMAAPRAAHAGYVATLNNATVLASDDKVANGFADAGESFTLTGGTFSNYTPDGAGDPQLNNADLANYSYNLLGTVASVTGTTVKYTGTYSINYAGWPGNPVSAGTFDIDAVFAGTTANLTGTMFETSAGGSPFQDLGAYSLVTFSGVYSPNTTPVPGQTNAGTLSQGVITAHGGAIPEPGSMALLATGLLPMAGLLRRRRKA